MTYIFFARWFGLISVILSLGILFHLNDAKAMAKSMIASETGYIMGGVLPVIFGSLVVLFHHKFPLGWEMVITIIGLFMLLIGIFRVLFVHQWKKLMSRHADKIPSLFSLFGLMAGLLMLYVGFIAPLVHAPTTFSVF